MIPADTQDFPLISVIIPCFNHADYIADAIGSVLSQTYENIEIIVVNDGSVDHTEEVVKEFRQVNYIFQENQGLSAARNTGIKNSHGKFLVFLDADDWLYSDGVFYNYEMLKASPEIAFVSGAHDKVNSQKEVIEEGITSIDCCHYYHLLQGNYIGMHGAVMYRRSVFDHFLFDVNLRACEDYDLYFKVARIFSVRHHQKKIAAYRFHGSNMSAKEGMMLRAALDVLERQRPFLISQSEEKAYRQGRKNWKDYYREIMIKKLISGKDERVWKDLWNIDKLEFLKQRVKMKLGL